MLSICIPIYNFYVDKLVNELQSQALLLNIDFEIILIDDFSDTQFKNQNKHLTELPRVKYIELPENIGRSKIRNLFLKHAQFNYLLFLDCDSFVNSSTFLKKYIETINNKTSVICGGHNYNSNKPEKEYRLRWKYGIKKEVIPFKFRMQNQYKSFKTINFLIEKNILKQISFDERISNYGHEDTLFGYQLKKKGIPIIHINNPVIHNHIETNSEFILKTEQSIKNLLFIQKLLSNNTYFEKEVSLLDAYQILKKTHTKQIAYSIWVVFHGLIRKLLVLGFVCISLFSFYKLGYFIHEQQIMNSTNSD